jgi:crossover junction endonuclease MUS81
MSPIRPASTSQPVRLQTPNSNPPDDVLGEASSASSIDPIILPPGTFTVELVLDVREVRTSKDRDYISNELSRKGITPHVRSLELGDAVWVAKCTDPTYLSRYGEEGDEVMLDWIVERKRLDDLIGSIKDGRFHEQKFRLGRSGMKNVVYLIEEFSAAVDNSGPGGMKYQDMVASAIASTQVVNGYFVKKTQNLDDSIRYLERMTRLLRNMYSGDNGSTNPTGRGVNTGKRPVKQLSIIPTKHLSSRSYLPLLSRLRTTKPDATHTITYAAFSALSSKSDTLSLRDLFLKMLMCTRGVSGEKALEIQRRWQTPREFIEAFETSGLGANGVTVKNQMVSDKMSALVGRKKVGRALSKKIAEIWGT